MTFNDFESLSEREREYLDYPVDLDDGQWWHHQDQLMQQQEQEQRGPES